MKDKSQGPRRLDVRRFAASGATLSGTLAAADLPRLVPDAPLAAGAPAAWTLTGEARTGAGAAPQTWLRLQTSAEVVLPCQRCLQPMTVPLVVDRRILFVADEAEAERLDEESDDDVLALPGSAGLDALALVEDELILALPLVPRHETCPQPLAVSETAAVPVDAELARPHPFAALAALRRGGGPGGDDPGGDGSGGDGPGQGGKAGGTGQGG